MADGEMSRKPAGIGTCPRIKKYLREIPEKAKLFASAFGRGVLGINEYLKEILYLINKESYKEFWG
jgi:hypothetical protein